MTQLPHPRPRTGPGRRWAVVLTEPQLRIVEFAVFALIDDAHGRALFDHNLSLAAAKRAYAAIERPERYQARRNSTHALA